MKTSKRIIPVIAILALLAILATLALTAAVGSTQRQIQNCISGTSCESVAGTTEDSTLTVAPSLTPSASVMPTHYQFIDPLAQTATYIVQEATTVQAMILPLMQSVTAVLAGATASVETEIALTPTPNPATRTAVFPTDQALGQTATYFLQGATQTAGAPMTLTVAAMLGIQPTSVDSLAQTATTIVQEATNQAQIDPLARTATAIVLGATQTAGAPMTLTVAAMLGVPPPSNMGIPTPTPTYSPYDLVNLQAEYRATLVTYFGFDHPVFQQISEELARDESQSDFRGGMLSPEISATWFNGYQYVAGVIRSRGYDPDTFYMFRIANGVPFLVRNPIRELGPWAYRLYVDSGGFADRNHNGRPDLTISMNSGGNCCPSRIAVLEISANGEVNDITPDIRGDAYPTGFVDVDHSGSLEIETWLPVYANNCCEATLNRLYGWDGTAYVDVSASHSEFYLSEINDIFRRVDLSGRCLRPSDDIYQVMVDYFVMGRLKDVWTAFGPHFDRDDCSPNQLADYGKQLDDFVGWVESSIYSISP